MAAAGLLVRISGDSFSNLGSGRPCRRPREPAFRGGTWEPGFPTRAAGGGRDSGSRELGLASGGDGETWTSGFLSQCVHFTGAHPVGGGVGLYASKPLPESVGSSRSLGSHQDNWGLRAETFPRGLAYLPPREGGSPAGFGAAGGSL